MYAGVVFDDEDRLLNSVIDLWNRYGSGGRDIHGHGQDTIFHEYLHGAHVLFADGKVRFAADGTDAETWHGLLTVNDGSPGPGWEETAGQLFQETRLRIGNCVLVVLFALLVLLPLGWVWRKPTSLEDDGAVSNESSAG